MSDVCLCVCLCWCLLSFVLFLISNDNSEGNRERTGNYHDLYPVWRAPGMSVSCYCFAQPPPPCSCQRDIKPEILVA
jgi:hypothetical protein